MCDGDVGKVNVAEWCLSCTIELDDPGKLGRDQLERIKLACNGDLGGEGRNEVKGMFCFIEKPLVRGVGLLLDVLDKVAVVETRQSVVLYVLGIWEKR